MAQLTELGEIMDEIIKRMSATMQSQPPQMLNDLRIGVWQCFSLSFAQCCHPTSARQADNIQLSQQLLCQDSM